MAWLSRSSLTLTQFLDRLLILYLKISHKHFLRGII
jgi:hypothetical protein